MPLGPGVHWVPDVGVGVGVGVGAVVSHAVGSGRVHGNSRVVGSGEAGQGGVYFGGREWLLGWLWSRWYCIDPERTRTLVGCPTAHRPTREEVVVKMAAGEVESRAFR